MKLFFILLLSFGVASGVQYNGLRAKFGWSEAQADKEHFYKLPLTLEQAENEGWRRAEPPSGLLEELQLYCLSERYVCMLYARSGFGAGLQIAFPAEDLNTPTTFKKWFTNWSVPASEGEPAKEYLAITQYWVSQESLATGAVPLVENGATLQDGGVWVNGPDGKLMRIPSTEAELSTTLFNKQNCIPNMGTHYHYNMSRETLCENLLPWFAVTKEGSLIGVGFQIFGELKTPPKDRDWMEIYKGRMIPEATIPHAPECLYENADIYPALTLHIFYIDDPWNISCRPEDSVEPAGVISRLMINVNRYSTSLFDNLKKIFNF